MRIFLPSQLRESENDRIKKNARVSKGSFLERKLQQQQKNNNIKGTDEKWKDLYL